MGGAKATVLLGGEPLVVRAVATLRAAGLDEVVVVAKRATALPPSLEAGVWIEPDEPRHPLAGMRFALTRARASAVMLPVDLQAPVAVLRALVGAEPTTVVRAGGRLHPLLGVFRDAPEGLGRATDAVLALAPHILDVNEPIADLNTPEELAAFGAARMGPSAPVRSTGPSSIGSPPAVSSGSMSSRVPSPRWPRCPRRSGRDDRER